MLFGLLQLAALARFEDSVRWGSVAAKVYLVLRLTVVPTGAFGLAGHRSADDAGGRLVRLQRQQPQQVEPDQQHQPDPGDVEGQGEGDHRDTSGTTMLLRR